MVYLLKSVRPAGACPDFETTSVLIPVKTGKPREDEVYDGRFRGTRAEPTDARVEFRSGVENADGPSRNDGAGPYRTQPASGGDLDSNAGLLSGFPRRRERTFPPLAGRPILLLFERATAEKENRSGLVKT